MASLSYAIAGTRDETVHDLSSTCSEVGNIVMYASSHVRRRVVQTYSSASHAISVHAPLKRVRKHRATNFDKDAIAICIEVVEGIHG